MARAKNGTIVRLIVRIVTDDANAGSGVRGGPRLDPPIPSRPIVGEAQEAEGRELRRL
jgi:hypothetical protein